MRLNTYNKILEITKRYLEKYDDFAYFMHKDYHIAYLVSDAGKVIRGNLGNINFYMPLNKFGLPVRDEVGNLEFKKILKDTFYKKTKIKNFKKHFCKKEIQVFN